MGLYDSVDRGKPKPKRLTGPIALCCALFLLFGGLTYWACHHQFRFHAFISDLTDSTRDARSTETFRVTVNGSETDVSIDEDVYKRQTWNLPTNPRRAQQCCLGRQKQVCTNLK